MGGIMSCFQAQDSAEPEVNREEVKKQEMSETDKAVLNLKKTKRMLDKNLKDLEDQIAKFWTAAKEEKRNKNDSKAVSLMKRRKLYQKYADAAQGKQLMVEETLERIKSAKIDVNVKEALEAGQEVIEDLRSKASIEDFENILERQQETQDQEEELRQMMQEAGIQDDEVEKDLQALEAEVFGKEVDQEIPSGKISSEETEPKEKVTKRAGKSKEKQMVAA